MGITLRNPSQDDFNQLKKMLADGKMSPQQFNAMPMDVGYDGPPPQLDAEAKNMLAQMMQQPVTQQQMMLSQAAQQSQPSPQNSNYIQVDGGARQQVGTSNGPSPQQLSDQASISKNADGVALSKLVAGGGYQNLNRGQGIIRMTQPDGATEDRYINDAPAQGAQAAPMKLYGYGNGTLSSLGNADADASSSADISRNPVDVPGLGKGYYSKDGRSAIITNSDGSKSQVLLGYDRAGSQAIDAYNMQRQKTQGDIAHTSAETDLVNAKVAEYSKPDAASANAAVSLSEVVDPKDPSRMLRVDARVYKGGTLGDAGVIGVSGKEPTLGKAEDKKIEGREGLKLDIQAMRDGYQKLDDLKSIPNIDNTPYENLKASIGSSDLGQAIGNKLGTNEQEIRNEIDASKRRLLSSIKAATNAGSREFGTNYEMKLWMDSIGNTQRPVGGNLDILNEFEKKYITGPEAREAAKKALNNPANANGSSVPNVTDSSNPSSNAAPALIRTADTSASIKNAQAAINSGKWTRAQAIEKLRAAGIMDTP